jgi:hypothetical protein
MQPDKSMSKHPQVVEASVFDDLKPSCFSAAPTAAVSGTNRFTAVNRPVQAPTSDNTSIPIFGGLYRCTPEFRDGLEIAMSLLQSWICFRTMVENPGTFRLVNV